MWLLKVKYIFELSKNYSENVWACARDLVLIALASREGSGKSVHMHRLARAFSASRKKVWI